MLVRRAQKKVDEEVLIFLIPADDFFNSGERFSRKRKFLMPKSIPTVPLLLQIGSLLIVI